MPACAPNDGAEPRLLSRTCALFLGLWTCPAATAVPHFQCTAPRWRKKAFRLTLRSGAVMLVAHRGRWHHLPTKDPLAIARGCKDGIRIRPLTVLFQDAAPSPVACRTTPRVAGFSKR